MGKKWGSNEDIHVGDIYQCICTAWDDLHTYYQVTALRGKTQVVLHAIHRETYINEGIGEDSPLYGMRKRQRPLPGQFKSFEDSGGLRFEWEVKGKLIELTTEELTAWVMPEKPGPDRRHRLRAVGLAWTKFEAWFEHTLPEDWEHWDAETIRKLEEYYRQQEEALDRYLAREKDVVWPEYPI